MSFQDVGPRPPLRMRRNHPPKLPRVTSTSTTSPSSDSARTRQQCSVPRIRPERKLDDDLLKIYSLKLSSSESTDDSLQESRDDRNDRGDERWQRSFTRDILPRKSTFAKLTHETQQYQKLVADLELILKDAGESPKAAWKARILVKSAQDTDKGLCEKLNGYEKSLLSNNSSNHDDLRMAQTACVKLHRDFKRSHEALVSCLVLYEARQKADVSRLGSTGGGWGGNQEDFFDRAMRQRELERMNESMRQVNDIYHELALLVDVQQSKIDRLAGEIDHAAANVKAGADEIHCYGKRGSFMCGAMNGCADDDVAISLSDDMDKPSDGLRVSEVFHWYMPFETLKEDMTSVKNDIVLVGKSIISKGKRLECCD